MAIQRTRLQGIRLKDNRSQMVADQLIANQFAQPMRSPHPQGELHRMGLRERQLKLMQRPERVRVGRRMEPREPISSWKHEANRTLGGRRADPGMLGTTPEGGSQELTFDQKERVARFRMDQADRQQRTLRDIAAQTLAQKNTEFAQRLALEDRNYSRQMDLRRMQAEDRAEERLDTDRKFGRAKELQEMLWRGRDRVTTEEDRRIRLGLLAEDRAMKAEDRGLEREKAALEIETERERLRQIREGGDTTGFERRRGQSTGRGGEPQGFTQGREGFYLATARKLGLAEGDLYGGDGELTAKGNEFLQTLDVLASSPEAENATTSDLVEAAAQHVGIRTTDELTRFDIEERRKSPDKAVRRQAQKEWEDLRRLDAQRAKEQSASDTQAQEFAPEEIQGFKEDMFAGLREGRGEDWNASMEIARTLNARGVLEPVDKAKLHRTLVETESIKKANADLWKQEKVDDKAVLELLGVDSTWGMFNPAQVRRQIAKKYLVDTKKAGQMIATARENLQRASYMDRIFGLYDFGDQSLEAHDKRMTEIRKAAARAGIEDL